jgi:uncharacterized membrane-anchored protein YitT (DUF2179 family)
MPAPREQAIAQSSTPAAGPIAAPHTTLEDFVALFTGTLIVALGVTLYSQAVLFIGGTAGASLLGQYSSPYAFWQIFFVINLPFYVFAILAMGWKMTLRTFLAVLLVTVFARYTPVWIDISEIRPAYAAIVGGMLIGLGMLILFRHGASLGGFNMLSLYLQNRFGIRAGYFQFGVDLVIVVCAFFILDPLSVAYSLLGAAVINIILAANHKAGRYAGVS